MPHASLILRVLAVTCLAVFGLTSCDRAEQLVPLTAPVTRAWAVMGTTLEVTVYRPEAQTLQALADLEAAHALVAALDQSMSLYKPDSDIVALNGRAGTGPVQVSQTFYDVLAASEFYASLSAGAFDVTVKPLIELWGFYTAEDTSIPSSADVDQTLQNVSMTNVFLNELTKTATLAPGTGIDLGGIAKGFAIDEVVALLKSRGVPAGLINLGGNVAVFGTGPRDGAWSIGLKHPRTDRVIGRVLLTEGAVSTSGDYDRFFERDGIRYTHILDPRTGWPVSGLNAVTVVARTATAADALSTAAFVLGAEKGGDLLERCTNVSGIFKEPDIQPNAGGNGEPGLSLTRTSLSSQSDVHSIEFSEGYTAQVYAGNGAQSQPDVECTFLR